MNQYNMLFDGETYSPIDESRLKNNLQWVFFAMQHCEWHSLADLRLVGGSAADSRVRDLRKPRFGGFEIETKNCGNGEWHYRIKPGTITNEKAKRVFDPIKEEGPAYG